MKKLMECLANVKMAAAPPMDTYVMELQFALEEELASLKQQLAEAQAKLAAAERENEELRQGLASRDETISWIEKELAALQAKLDAVMLEYCPDEMTPEQIAEWGKHQVQSTEQWNETMRQKKAWADGKDAEPVAWRTFDGEGGYDLRNYTDNENYKEWYATYNPKYPHWCEPLYLAPPTAEALVEDFKRRVLEAISPSPTLKVSKAFQPMKEAGDVVREVLADIIESLPLIGEK